MPTGQYAQVSFANDIATSKDYVIVSYGYDGYFDNDALVSAGHNWASKFAIYDANLKLVEIIYVKPNTQSDGKFNGLSGGDAYYGDRGQSSGEFFIHDNRWLVMRTNNIREGSTRIPAYGVVDLQNLNSLKYTFTYNDTDYDMVDWSFVCRLSADGRDDNGDRVRYPQLFTAGNKKKIATCVWASDIDSGSGVDRFEPAVYVIDVDDMIQAGVTAGTAFIEYTMEELLVFVGDGSTKTFDQYEEGSQFYGQGNDVIFNLDHGAPDTKPETFRHHKSITSSSDRWRPMLSVGDDMIIVTDGIKSEIWDYQDPTGWSARPAYVNLEHNGKIYDQKLYGYNFRISDLNDPNTIDSFPYVSDKSWHPSNMDRLIVADPTTE